MKVDKQGQKTFTANIEQSQESVVINADQTILIDGKEADCSQEACQSKDGGATVAKVQTPDGKCQIDLSIKVRISLAYSCLQVSYRFLFSLERALFNWCVVKAKAKTITMANHRNVKQDNEPMKAPSQYTSSVPRAGKRMQARRDWFWFSSLLIGGVNSVNFSSKLWNTESKA